VFEKRVLSRICGPKTNKVTGSLRKMHNEDLHNLYSSPNIIRMIKSRRMRWAGRLVQIGRREMHVGYWRESHKEEDH
jgi:hypothetical protein